MRIVIIGAVAAGTSAAAKARRNNEEAEIIIYERDGDISYSGCGMPYFISGEIESYSDIVPRDAAFFKRKYNVDIHTGHEVLSINTDAKSIEVKDLSSNRVFTDKYDKLIIATGARAFVPPIEGADKPHAFTLRSVADMNRIIDFYEKNSPKTATVIGSGYVGLEISESLKKLGMQVTVVEILPHVTPGLDDDIATYVEDHLVGNGVKVLTGQTVVAISDQDVILKDGSKLPSDMVIMATGVRPNTELAKSAGVELGVANAIKVDSRMRTNIEDVYSCGDCTEHFNLVTGKPSYHPLGSTANKTGRICGDSITGGDLQFRGVLGTGIFRLFDLSIAQTGLSESRAREEGFDIVAIHNIKPNKPTSMGGEKMVIKAIANKTDGKLLGVQIVGKEGVDKRIDVFATAITFGAVAEDLLHLDLAYSPPFSTTKDPVIYTGMILDNVISKERPNMTADQLTDLMESGKEYNLIDTRVDEQYQTAHIENAKNIPHDRLRDEIDAMDKDTVAITYCNNGTTGNAAQNIMLNKGFKEVYNLSGGHAHYKKCGEIYKGKDND